MFYTMTHYTRSVWCVNAFNMNYFDLYLFLILKENIILVRYFLEILKTHHSIAQDKIQEKEPFDNNNLLIWFIFKRPSRVDTKHL